MRKPIANIHYITQDTEHSSHEQLTQKACKAGVSWVQLRVKNKAEEEYIKIAKAVKLICEEYDVTLIINDNVAVAKAINADGVHIGKSDMAPSEARTILGKKAIIGCTANTFADIELLAKYDIDYIGLGPFKFTKTKENLSPILGVEGYNTIINQCEKAKVKLPIIAIGGITEKDCEALSTINIDGIAVSSAITNAANTARTVNYFKDNLWKI